MGEGAEEIEDRPGEQAQIQRAEGPQAGADADDANLPAAAGQEEAVRGGAEGEHAEREAQAGGGGVEGKVRGNGVGVVPEDWGDLVAQDSVEGVPGTFKKIFFKVSHNKYFAFRTTKPTNARSCCRSVPTIAIYENSWRRRTEK